MSTHPTSLPGSLKPVNLGGSQTPGGDYQRHFCSPSALAHAIDSADRIWYKSHAVAELSPEVAEQNCTACVKMEDVIIPPGAQVRNSLASLHWMQVVAFPLCVYTVHAWGKLMGVLMCRFTDEHSLHR